MAFLEVDDIKTYYGNIQALKGVSLTVEEGECVTLIGSNGAGKSTTLRSISGLTPPRTGSIKLAGEEISMLPPQEIVGLGICQSPEGRKCFQRMTVRENLELGAYLRRDSAGIDKRSQAGLRALPAPGRAPEPEGGHDVRRRAADARDRPRADGQARRCCCSTSRRWASRPVLTERIYETIEKINKEGMTILLVEQNANFALDVSKRAYVLETGKVEHVRQLGRAADQPRSPEGVPRNMTVLALMGATALWLLYLWLASCIIAGYLSNRKGYGDKPGVATGLCLSAIAIIVWLVWPAKPESKWKVDRTVRLAARTPPIAGSPSALRSSDLRAAGRPRVSARPAAAGWPLDAGVRVVEALPARHVAAHRPRPPARAPAGRSPAGRRGRGGVGVIDANTRGPRARSRTAAVGGEFAWSRR